MDWFYIFLGIVVVGLGMGALGIRELYKAIILRDDEPEDHHDKMYCSRCNEDVETDSAIDENLERDYVYCKECRLILRDDWD